MIRLLTLIFEFFTRLFDYFAVRKSTSTSVDSIKQQHSKDPTDSAFDKDMWRD